LLVEDGVALGVHNNTTYRKNAAQQAIDFLITYITFSRIDIINNNVHGFLMGFGLVEFNYLDPWNFADGDVLITVKLV
jgi:hypothetical protein